MSVDVNLRKLASFVMPSVIVAVMLAVLTGCTSASSPVKPSANAKQYRLLEREVFNETNLLRSAPKAYVKILQEISRRMSGHVYYPLNSKAGIVTNEGPGAVHEAVAVLRKQKPLRKLNWSDELAGLARAHVVDTGVKGIVSHDSSKGRSFSERVASVIARGKFNGAAENLSYGYSNGRDVVAQLFVDDGVPDRGHRNNLLKQQLTHVGVACGYHREYRHMCAAIYGTK